MIGIFGGTFDPVHNGHLRTCLDVQESVGLDEVRLVPVSRAVHREQPVVPPGIRLALVRAAVGDTPGLVVDDRELSRGGASYMYDTLRSLRRDLGSGVPLCLILGADAFSGFLSWHRPFDILDEAHIVVMERPGHVLREEGALGELVGDRRVHDGGSLRTRAAGSVFSVSVTQLEISATDVRRRVAEGRSISFLVPARIEEIIGRLGLYRTPGGLP
jgi:nicotinate-nucleotide adenylyltransferase